MRITILTLFKNFFNEFLETSIIKNAIKNKIVTIDIIDFREFSIDKHKKVDDYQYGGGPGMVLTLQPIVDCINHFKTKNSKVFLTSPSGKKLNQEMLINLSKNDHIILIAGHYEGFDSRIEHFIDGEISIGDYILTGGELPCMIIADGITRLLDNAINKDSLINESFNNNLLDYPIYTKPKNYNGYDVPEVLLSGDHQKINKYRFNEQIKITKKKRPDLYKKFMKGNKHEN